MKLDKIASLFAPVLDLRSGYCRRQSLLCLMLTLSVPSASFAQETQAPQDVAPLADVSLGLKPAAEMEPQVLPEVLRSGDKVSIAFYESLESEEDRWGGQKGSVPRRFYQRPELTGDYLVEPDGAISLPLLGRFPIQGLLPAAVEASLLHSYENLVGRDGFVNIIKIEHQPVYITGPVRNAGSFKYVNGLTVMHVVAQAGGMTEKGPEPWQRVEIARQIERLKSGLTELKRIASRTEVLRAARDSVKVASLGTGIVGPDPEARRLLDDETWQRKMVVTSRDAQHDIYAKAVANAQADLELRKARIGNYDATIRVRQDRLTSVENLARNKLVNSIELSRAQSELTESEDRKQQAIIDFEAAKQRLAAATQDLERDGIERRIEVEKSTADAERGLSTALKTTESDLEIFRSMVSSNDSGITEYEIVRLGPNGITVEPATEETVLQPGDLVKVR